MTMMTMTVIAASRPVKYSFLVVSLSRTAGRRREQFPVCCYGPVRKLESRFKRCMLIRDLVCAAVAPHYEDFQFYAAATTNKYLPRQTSPRVTTPIPPLIIPLMPLTLLSVTLSRSSYSAVSAARLMIASLSFSLFRALSFSLWI